LPLVKKGIGHTVRDNEVLEKSIRDQLEEKNRRAYFERSKDMVRENPLLRIKDHIFQCL
jgi:hypothetical protein